MKEKEFVITEPWEIRIFQKNSIAQTIAKTFVDATSDSNGRAENDIRVGEKMVDVACSKDGEYIHIEIKIDEVQIAEGRYPEGIDGEDFNEMATSIAQVILDTCLPE